MILTAQAVPSAAFLPCIAALPSGWSVAGAEIASGRASFVLSSGFEAGAAAFISSLASQGSCRR